MRNLPFWTQKRVSRGVVPLSNANARRFDCFRPLSSVGMTLVRHAALRMHALARHALPQSCALCAAPAGDALVCWACAAAMPRIDLPCAQCALPSGTGGRCGECLTHRPPFERTLAAFAYAFPVNRLLHRLKYAGALALADWAASAWLDRFAGEIAQGARPDVVLAIPLTATRQRERGFNQAQEIARRIARALAIPMAGDLERVRDTAAQAALPWSVRKTNLRDAFRCTRAVAGKSCALIDDVMTTGATVREAARALRRAGATSVSVWVIARTLKSEQAS